jgi:hypothetical protein
MGTGCTWPNNHVGGAQDGLASVWYHVRFLAVEADTSAPSTSGTAMAMTCGSGTLGSTA